MNVADSNTATSLYDKIGGEAAVRRLVNEFYERVLADPSLAPYFRDVSMDKLLRMQFEFFAAALGGEVKYTGRPVVHAHQGHKISLSAFQRFVHCFFETLNPYSLSEAERYEIVSRLNGYANDIVGEGTGQPN